MYKSIVTVGLLFIVIGCEQKHVTPEADYSHCFVLFEEMPEYPGGLDSLKSFICRELKYPEQAKKKAISGKVYVSFVIDEVGEVTNVKVMRGVDSLLDKEAVRVVKSLPDFKPGRFRTVPVKCSFTVPINFILDKEQK